MSWSPVLMLAFILLLISGCTDQKKYNLKIYSKHTDTKEEKEEIRKLTSINDSSAYKRACEEYWILKSAKMTVYKKTEFPDYIPFYFSLERDNGSSVSYSKEEAERLTQEIVDYFKNKVMPGIDTITPYSKLPKSEPPKIY